MAPEHFDAVVVGSGFGGSVMACRLAEAGLSVCVLERGRSYPPGSFPRSPRGMRHNFWDPSEGLYGMYNVWSFRGTEALVSSGLGGGSLIYANVLLRKPERWFVREEPGRKGYEYWPVTREELDPCYDAAERMLGAQRYPFGDPPYDQTPKTVALKFAADRLGLEWQLPDLAVSFANPGEKPVLGEPLREEDPNLHGRTRYTCRLCGECDIGCNFGSKNTLDYNYLTVAARAGAQLRWLHEVRSFAPRPEGGYRIRYVQHDLAREGRRTRTRELPQREVTADRLVLSAGALGSTFLLLRMRAEEPAFGRLSDRLGSQYSGNGDLLTFALRCNEDRDGERVPRMMDAGRGPVITSTIHVPDAVDGGDGRGFYVQDAGYPDFMGWILEMSEVRGLARRAFGFVRDRIRDRVWRRNESDLGAEIAAVLGACTTSSSSMPLLGMGRDVPDGTMSLRQDRLYVDWINEKSGPYFDRVRATMKEIAGSWDAAFRDNLLWYLNRRVVTVHPLGGCPMGRTREEGVVDAHGQVFGYPGLYVADGAVMPGPVGPNPSLTIAALAERFAQGILERRAPA